MLLTMYTLLSIKALYSVYNYVVCIKLDMENIQLMKFKLILYFTLCLNLDRDTENLVV